MVLRSWGTFSSLLFLAADSSVLFFFPRCNPDKLDIINRDLFICNNALDKQFVFKQDVRYMHIQFFLSFFFFSIFKTNKEKTPDHKWTRESKRTFPFPTVTGLTGTALSPSPLFDQSHRFPSLPSPSLSLQTWVDMVCVTQVGLSP